MLTEKDKKFLTEEIHKAVREELTVEVQWEKVRDEKTGQKNARVEIIKEKVFLPSFFIQQLYFQEGAFRGVQEDINSVAKDFKVNKDGINAIAALLIDMEDGIKTFVKASQKIQERLEHIERKQIEE